MKLYIRQNKLEIPDDASKNLIQQMWEVFLEGGLNTNYAKAQEILDENDYQFFDEDLVEPFKNFKVNRTYYLGPNYYDYERNGSFLKKLFRVFFDAKGVVKRFEANFDSLSPYENFMRKIINQFPGERIAAHLIYNLEFNIHDYTGLEDFLIRNVSVELKDDSNEVLKQRKSLCTELLLEYRGLNPELTKEYVELRIADWIDRINNLYADIKIWVNDRDGFNITQTSSLQNVEEMMQRYDVRPRKVPVLTVSKGNKKIQLIPNALWVIGANGRINVITENKQFTLVDRSERFSVFRDWCLVTNEIKNNVIPFNKEVLNQYLLTSL